MSIASQITSLVTAVANAINSRGAAGPSDYQMWLAQGNTGTLQDYRTSLVGPDEDYAAYFTANLGAFPTSGTASTTQAGITQLATLAETATGTSVAKAVTPAGLAGTLASTTQVGVTQYATTAEAIAGTSAVKALTPAAYTAARTQYQITSLSSLNTVAATATEGTLLHLRQFALSGGTHYRSLWMATGSGAIPYGTIEVSNSTALDNIVSGLSGLSNLSLLSYTTKGYVRGPRWGSDFTWNGSAWVNRNPAPFQIVNDGGANTVQAFGSGFVKATALSVTHPDWDDTNKNWTCPADGTYFMNSSIRWADSTPNTNNLGVSVLPSASTGPSSLFGWGTPGAAGTPRFQTTFGRQWSTTKGTQFSLFAYCNTAANAQAIDFSIVKLSD